MNINTPNRKDLVPPQLTPGADLISEGRAAARQWRLGESRFMRENGVASEAAYKRSAMSAGRTMQHAHIGFRNVDRTIWGIQQVHETCARGGVKVDRFGITLDWSMGYPEAQRRKAGRGTGIVLSGPECGLKLQF